MPLLRQGDHRGKITFEISVVPQEEANDADIDADNFMSNMQSLGASVSTIKGGATADKLLKKPIEA